MSVSTNVTTPVGSSEGTGSASTSASAAVVTRVASPGSCARMPRSSSRRRSPGSMPSSSTSILPGVLVGLERVGLAVGAVEGEHQLGPETLPVRVLVDERLELPDHLAVAAEHELRLDQPFERDGMQLVEPGGLALRERLVGEVGQRRAAPQRERLLEGRHRGLRASRVELGPGLRHEPLEPVRVELLGVELELVAVVARDDHVRGPASERLPEPGDVHLQRLGGRRRRVLAPQLVDHAIGAERLVRVQQEQREHGSALAAAQRDALASFESLERAEDAEVHASGGRGRPGGPPNVPQAVSARQRAVAAAVTAASPCCNRPPGGSLHNVAQTNHRAGPQAPTREEAVMGHAIPKQHPAVVLRSHYNLVRALLGVAMIALVGLVIALVVVANDDNEPASTSAVQAVPVTPQVAPALPAYPTPVPEAVSPGADRSYSGAVPTRKLDGSTDIGRTAPAQPGTRYDGGPEEGTRGAIASPPVAPGTRYDGGPEEGTRGAITSPVAPGTRYDGGPDEGTRGPITSQVAPGSGGIDESQSGPGFRTD